MIAEIIAAGSEMLTPFRQDTNSLYLTDGLNDLGVQVAFKTIVGDNLAHLTSAALIALSRADVVIFSGGLGPTEDDLTREAVAAALGIGLHSDNDILAALYKRFAARKRKRHAIHGEAALGNILRHIDSRIERADRKTKRFSQAANIQNLLRHVRSISGQGCTVLGDLQRSRQRELVRASQRRIP